MIPDKNKIKTIKNMILRGFVKHSEIKPELNRAELSNINPDDISQLSIDYKTRGNKVIQKISKNILSLINKAAAVIISLCSGFIYADFTATKIFSETVLKDKLTGFGDSLRYWLGFKKIDLSASDIFNSVYAIIKATPFIIKNFFIGFIIGLFCWFVLIIIFSFIYKRKKLHHDIIKLIKKNGY